jgi:polyisoprenoid-binding protein YceI
MGSKVSGRLDLIEGTVVYDPARPEATIVKGTISPASVDTGNPIRDARLKSEEFFDASSFPQMTFVSNGAHLRRRILEVMGDLTLRGTTRPVTLTIKRLTTEGGKGEEGQLLRATARTTIHRLDFGVGLVTLAQIANSLIGDEVTVVIDAVLTPA